MIALILGGAPSVFAETEAAAALLNRRHQVVAANLAGIHFPGRLDGWATLHTDRLAEWSAERRGGPAGRLFTPDATPERWPGSSGLYALQCALFETGATAAILCGVPMDTGAGHFAQPGAWAGTEDYRRAFAAALPLIGGRTRSMGGWTAALFGTPSPEWVGAVDNIQPLGQSAPANARAEAMFHVKNNSEISHKVWARRADGLTELHHLAPGDALDLDVDPGDPVFQAEGLSATKPRASAPAARPADAPKS